MEVIDRIAMAVGSRRLLLGGVLSTLLSFTHASAKKKSNKKKRKQNKSTSSGVGAEIVNGTPVASAEHVVSLHITGDWTLTEDTFFCTGSLIDPSHVLTANHCLDVDYPISIIAGRTNLNDVGTGEIRRVTRAIQISGRDMAVLRLESPITSVTPALLPGAEHAYLKSPGASLTFAGWGSNTPDKVGKKGPAPAYSPFLLSTVLNIVKPKTCLKAWSSKKKGKKKKKKKPNWLKTGICTRAKGTDTCWGDSGAGGYGTLPNGRRVIMAVVSGGLGCADFDYPGINEDVLSASGAIHAAMG